MSGTTQPAGMQFLAVLSGANEVPPVASAAQGAAMVNFDPTLTTLTAGVSATNLRQVTAAHIHIGRAGQNGPIVLTLFGPRAPMDVLTPSVLTNRAFTAANLEGSLAGQPLSVLAQNMAAGNTYVNVHTTANPGGEIRGQLVRRP